MKNILLIIFALGAFKMSGAQVQEADSLLNFLSSHRKTSSLYFVKNDTVMARLNENKLMPLASTVKMLVAVEFAKQAAAHVINAGSPVSLTDLGKYYLPNTDGGAHPAWLKYEKQVNHIKDDSISLLNVARGMMMFSSNANTEYLMDLLGLDNVKNNIQLLGLEPHTPVYPLVASLFVYQNPRNKSEESILKSIRKLNDQSFARYTYDIHNALKYNPELKAKFRPQDLSPEMQSLWSDRLPASTAKSYARLAKVINNRKFFEADTYAVLADIMESLMENPANRQLFKHAGMKGGSTAKLLTKCVYATTIAGDKIELAYFFNELSNVENAQLQHWMNSFEYMLLLDPNFQNKVSSTFK